MKANERKKALAAYKTRLDELDGEKEALAEQRRNVMNDARTLAPVQVGDELTIPEKAFAHVGRRAVVTAVYLKRDFMEKWEWHVHAVPLTQAGRRMNGRSHWGIKC